MVLAEILLMLSGALIAGGYCLGCVHQFRAGYRKGYEQAQKEHAISEGAYDRGVQDFKLIYVKGEAMKDEG